MTVVGVGIAISVGGVVLISLTQGAGDIAPDSSPRSFPLYRRKKIKALAGIHFVSVLVIFVCRMSE